MEDLLVYGTHIGEALIGGILLKNIKNDEKET